MLSSILFRRNRHRVAIAVVLVGVIVLGSVRGGYAAEDKEQSGAVITGKVVFTGKAPKRKLINMALDPGCSTKDHPKAYTETVIVNENQTLRNVMVYIKGGDGKKAGEPPSEKFLLDQAGCMYHPHVFGVMVGQALVIRNDDNTLHNVHGHPRINAPFNLGQPQKGMEETRRFKKAEEGFAIKCDVHPWMVTYCWVFDHPYFSVTGEEGTFTIPNLPAGEYDVEAWHEKYGKLSQKVTIKEGETKKEIEFNFEPKEK